MYNIHPNTDLFFHLLRSSMYLKTVFLFKDKFLYIFCKSVFKSCLFFQCSFLLIIFKYRNVVYILSLLQSTMLPNYLILIACLLFLRISRYLLYLEIWQIINFFYFLQNFPDNIKSYCHSCVFPDLNGNATCFLLIIMLFY